MKILIKGHAGSGKSTLGKILSRHYRIPVLHLDSVYWLPEWQHRNDDEFNKIVLDFMKKNEIFVSPLATATLLKRKEIGSFL